MPQCSALCRASRFVTDARVRNSAAASNHRSASQFTGARGVGMPQTTRTRAEQPAQTPVRGSPCAGLWGLRRYETPLPPQTTAGATMLSIADTRTAEAAAAATAAAALATRATGASRAPCRAVSTSQARSVCQRPQPCRGRARRCDQSRQPSRACAR